MSGQAAVEVEAASTWAPEPRHETTDWRTVDRALRSIAQRRAALDADEARWLREAEALQIWRPLGMVSAIDYLERALGYAPRTAQDRLRVARALAALPQLTAALAGGELAFSAVRELTRVATPATEAAWVARATGMNVRQIAELVADHRPGDHPDDPPDPEARTHVVRFELAAETFARLRQARMVLDNEHGTNLPDDAFVAALCSAVIDGASSTEPTGRAKFQIAVTVCERCRQGWQEGAGAQIAIGAAAVERAMCDAQHIGSIDGDAPERAYQDISPSVARFVWRRDGGRCRTPGCRSARGLELHHLRHRADGGSHDASNLTLLCSSCHVAHHAGTLTITGTADHLEVHRRGQATSVARTRAHVGATVEPGAADAHATVEPSSAVHVDAPIESGDDAGGSVEPNAGARVGGSVEPTADAHVGASIEPSADADAVASVEPGPDAHVGAPGTPSCNNNSSAGGVASSRLDAAVRRAQTKDALIGLGWKPAIAGPAVAAAVAALGPEATLEQLVFEALRRCPRPVVTRHHHVRDP